MYRQALIDGLWRRNVASAQLLGLCPLLAVSYNLRNAIGLSVASSFVLVGSSLAISSIRKLIPNNVRLPCFVLVIATLTTVTTMYMQAFAYDLYVQIALFVQIIVTNCMILGHIESVASKTPVGESLVTAIGHSTRIFERIAPIRRNSTGIGTSHTLGDSSGGSVSGRRVDSGWSKFCFRPCR